jgi:glycosyltransferase involved in cell wall biosynthesis
MHIAIDARIINSSTGRYVERLVYYLQLVDTANHYTILVPTKDLTFFKPTNKNFTVMAADFDNYSFAEQRQFKTFLDQLAPDLVHFCMPQQPIFYSGAHVTTVHDLILLQTYNSDKNWLIFHAKQLVGRYVFKKIGHTSQHIITPSRFTKDGYVAFAGIAENKVSVTYEAADVSIETLRPYTHPFKKFILYVGQQSDYKNIRRLGDAHQKLLETHPDLGLILVGKKTASHIQNETYFKAKGYKNIHFTGFISDGERDWLYTHCQAYIFPSLMEGFGLPGLEAMSYGAPVASSSATCLPEIYEEAAHYFDPLDASDMSRAINDVLTDESLRKSLIKKGHEQVKKYSWKRMTQQTHTIYMNALKDKN